MSAFQHLLTDSVVGVNLVDTQSAPKVIKTWDERRDEEQYVESGVDDEVGSLVQRFTQAAPLTPQLILYIPFTASLRLRTLLLHLPQPSHPHRPGRLRIFPNLTNVPDFSDVEAMTPVMDIDISSPRVQARDTTGQREVDEFGLKVQKMASVFSVTLVFVSTEMRWGGRSEQISLPVENLLHHPLMRNALTPSPTRRQPCDPRSFMSGSRATRNRPTWTCPGWARSRHRTRRTSPSTASPRSRTRDTPPSVDRESASRQNTPLPRTHDTMPTVMLYTWFIHLYREREFMNPSSLRSTRLLVLERGEAPDALVALDALALPLGLGSGAEALLVKVDRGGVPLQCERLTDKGSTRNTCPHSP